MDDEIKRALMEKVSVPPQIAGKAFGLGRNASYAAVKNGDLPSIRIGNKIAVPTAPLRRKLGIEDGKAA
jgi:hypothetical protein